jgi:TRAP-type mannitol/chloroaromatic compound transport system permease small subunit
VDIFYANFSTKTQNIVDLVSLLLFILPFSSLILYVGYDFVLQSYTQMEGSSDPGGLPYRYLVKSLMLLSFVFLILQALSEIVKKIKVIKS